MAELSKSFELECDILDRDHQILLQQINKIVAVVDGEGDEECAKLAPEMIKFAKQHFTREEALLTKVGYPDVAKHAEHHQNLDHKMETILELAAMADENPLAGEKLKSALKFFLTDDIIDADLDFKSFVKDRDAE
ncbi:MAG: hemerythrin family protein [Rhodospirillales bacterium]